MNKVIIVDKKRKKKNRSKKITIELNIKKINRLYRIKLN